MRLFANTLFAFMLVSMATTLVMSCHYLEKYRTKANDLESENKELRLEAGNYEFLYMKCRGDELTERMGGHYKDGKLRFYKY
jgi:hypothetical protein